jgi:hypothetical protein
MTATTLFYSDKGWFVSYRTAAGNFRHDKVASRASDRPSDEELTAKGYEVIR